MTIPYPNNIVRGLFIWHGSLYYLVWRDLLICLIIFYIINLSLRFGLKKDQKLQFVEVRNSLKEKLANYNLLFILGFFLHQIYDRMWKQFEFLAFNPSRITMVVSTFVRAGATMDAARAESIRLSFTRWLAAMTVLAWRRHSNRLINRFPTIDHLTQAKLLTPSEAEMIKQTEKIAPYGNWWQPNIWINNAIYELTAEGVWTVYTADLLRVVVDEYRMKMDSMMNYHWVPVPLPYTQLVTCATLFYFLMEILAHQMLDEGEDFDFYVPVFLIVKLVLFVGVLRVSEEIMDPFGGDPDDFETNWILEWNVNTSLLHMGPLHGQMPRYDDNGLAGATCIHLPNPDEGVGSKTRPYTNKTD